jgi:L-alanine-DL-glutamate epimerase-like enolase superfamily enzyme
MLKTDPVIGGMTYGDGGTITLPDTPGLGATIDPDFLSTLEVYVIELQN